MENQLKICNEVITAILNNNVEIKDIYKPSIYIMKHLEKIQFEIYNLLEIVLLENEYDEMEEITYQSLINNIDTFNTCNVYTHRKLGCNIESILEELINTILEPLTILYSDNLILVKEISKIIILIRG